MLYLDYTFTEVIPNDSSDNESILVQVRAWFQTGSKPLAEPMITQVIHALPDLDGLNGL